MVEWVISTSLLIVIVIALRQLLKDRIQPCVRYALWLVVLARLLVPFQFGEFDFSMMNGVEQLPMVQEIDSMRNVDQIAHMEDGSVEGYDLSGLSEDTPQIVARNKTDQEYERMETSLKLRNLCAAVWKAGMLLMAAVFLAGNGKFRAKLICSRRLLSMENMACPVYVTESVDTPCLFGLFKPAIYVTPEVAADSRTLRYAVEHEMSHYRQKDPIWSLLRCICLILQWFNPLAWAAAVLSKNDCELACDAATIRRLGEEERADYGRTLIEMTKPGRRVLLINATTMTGSKHALKERIEMIAKKPKMAVYTLIAVLVIAAAAVMVTFTGAKNDAFYDWLQNTDVSQIEQMEVIQWRGDGALFSMSAEVGNMASENNETEEKLIRLLQGIQKSDLEYSETPYPGTAGDGLMLSIRDERKKMIQGVCFSLTDDGRLFVTFDVETEMELCGTDEAGVGWWVDSPELTTFIEEKLDEKAPEMEERVMTFLQTVEAEYLDQWYDEIQRTDMKKITACLQRLAAEEYSVKPETLPTEQWKKYFSVNARTAPAAEDINVLSIGCGTEQNIVRISCSSNRGGGVIYYDDIELYQLIRNSENAETDLMSFLKTVQAADFDRDYLIGNVSFEELAEVLNQVTEGEMTMIPEQPETQYWRIDAFLKASPEEEDSDEEPRRQIYLSCGLEENLVEVEYYSGAGASERMVFHDETLYQLVRHSRDYEEIVDPEAYEKFADILVPQMEFHMNSMSEANPGIYDYELTLFCRIGAYEEEDGSRVELYDFDYALLTDDVESIVWAGGMRLDSQCRLHGFNGGGQFAVRYRGGKVTATAFMGNDFWVSSADFENKEAQEWIKERLKNALDQAE